MFEHHKQKIASRRVFIRRIAYSIFISLLLMIFCLAIGTVGYYYWGDLSWINSFHNASMILSGMGLVDQIHSNSGKIFSSIYALFSGIIFITNLGIILAPAAHRLIHKFHLQEN